MKYYTEGIAFDGVAILEDGVPITITDILNKLNKLAKLEDKDKDIISFPFNSSVTKLQKLLEVKYNTIITNERMIEITISYNHDNKKFNKDIKDLEKELYNQ